MTKKSLLFTLIIVLSSNIFKAQNLNYKQKLYYTCKVWGFVKYFHSGVSTCQVNWDSVLVAHLPSIKNAVTNSDFNNVLDTLLSAAGPMAIVPGVLPDTSSTELKRNRDFSWSNDPVFRSEVKVILDTIKNNFRPHAECWVQNGSTSGWLSFPHDDPMLPLAVGTSFPDEFHRILILFKYWNIVKYFNPNNYVQDVPWDSTLYNKSSLFIQATDSTSLYLALKKCASAIDDAHAEGLTTDTYFAFRGYYSPALILRYAQNKYIVAKSGIPQIHRGDAIISVNRLSTTAWEDSLRPYISAGNNAVFRRYMCQYLLCGNFYESMGIVYSDSLGVSHSIYPTRDNYTGNSWMSSYYPNDTLANVKWKSFGCGVGYVNMGQLQSSDVNPMYAAFQNSSAIIFDLRNYPNGTGPSIVNLMYPGVVNFSKDMLPDITYPGTYSWYGDTYGNNFNPNPYHGKVIMLINEETQSQAEYTCMMLGAMSNSVKVGNQTAGADGNISYFYLSPDLTTGFSTIGVFYPNGDSTQRIGIKPDSVVNITQIGIREGIDELLNKALEIANCPMFANEIKSDSPEISIYPNPSSSLLNLNMSGLERGQLIVEVMNLNGKVIKNQQGVSESATVKMVLDVSNLCSGMYLIKITTSGGSYVRKIIVQ